MASEYVQFGRQSGLYLNGSWLEPQGRLSMTLKTRLTTTLGSAALCAGLAVGASAQASAHNV